MKNEIDNVTSPCLRLTTLQAGRKKILHFFLFVYEITQFVQLAGIQLTIQYSSNYLFGFLVICPDFLLSDGATIFKGM